MALDDRTDRRTLPAANDTFRPMEPPPPIPVLDVRFMNNNPPGRATQPTGPAPEHFSPEAIPGTSLKKARSGSK